MAKLIKKFKDLIEYMNIMMDSKQVIGKIGKIRDANYFSYKDPNNNPSHYIVQFYGQKGILRKILVNANQGVKEVATKAYLPLYKVESDAGKHETPIVIVGDERTADALKKQFNKLQWTGFITTSTLRNGLTSKNDWSVVKNRKVVVFPDNNAVGKEYAEEVSNVAFLSGAKEVSTVEYLGKFEKYESILQILQEEESYFVIKDILKCTKLHLGCLTKPKDILKIIRPIGCKTFLKEKPRPREFIISNILPKVPCSIIAAPGGLGKSYFAMQMGISVASGLDFLGRFDIKSPGSVLYVSFEDEESEIHRRFLSCKEVIFDELQKEELQSSRKKLESNFNIFSLVGKHNLSFYPDSEGIKEEFVRVALKFKELKLIIFDPINRIMNEDFNNAQMVSGFMQNMEEISSRTGASIILITHSNKSSQKLSGNLKSDANSVFGSQSFVNSSRHLITLSNKKKGDSKENNDFLVSLRIPKSNYLPPGFGEIVLERIINNDDKNEFLGGGFKIFEDIKARITPEIIEKFAKNNTELGKTDFVNQLVKKIGVSRKTVKKNIELAISFNFIKEIQTGVKNKSIYKSIK